MNAVGTGSITLPDTLLGKAPACNRGDCGIEIKRQMRQLRSTRMMRVLVALYRVSIILPNMYSAAV